MTFRNPILGAGGSTLLRPAIQSPNYVTGSTGWAIKRDGSAEFNNVVIRGGTVVSGLALYYDGTPAAGNLIMSISAAAGVDSFGNAYVKGVGVYSPLGELVLDAGDGLFQSTGSSGAIVTINDGQVTFLANATDQSTATIIQNLIAGHGSLYIDGGQQGVNDRAAMVGIVTSNGTPTAGNQDTFPRLNTMASNGTTLAYHYVSGAMVKSNAVGSTSETWQTPAFSGTWSSTGTLNGNSTFRGLQYRKDAEDNVWILGGATTTGAGGSIFTLPAGYFNSSRRTLMPCYIFDSSAAAVVSGFAQVTETGIVNISATLSGVTIAAGDQVFINGKFPLANIA